MAAHAGTMVRVKTASLTKSALDWSVAQCEGLYIDLGVNWGAGPAADLVTTYHGQVMFHRPDGSRWAPSTDAAVGMPIAERAGISILRCDDDDYECEPWAAIKGPMRRTRDGHGQGAVYMQYLSHLVYGPTQLVAALRCLVVNRYGPELDVPATLVA